MFDILFLIFFILLLLGVLRVISGETKNMLGEKNGSFIRGQVAVKLQVAEAEERDSGRGIARVSQKTMKTLGVSPGDIIEIVGRKITSATVWPAYEKDQNLDIIRIDEVTRKNANVSVDDFVIVRPAEVKRAKYVMLAPIDMKLKVDEDFTRFVGARFTNKTLVEGDIIILLLLGHALSFKVIVTEPKGIVKVDFSTKLEILECLENFKQQETMEQTTCEIKPKNENIATSVTPDLNTMEQNAMQSLRKIKTCDQPLGVLILPDQTELPITSSLVIGRKDLEKYVTQEKACGFPNNT